MDKIEQKTETESEPVHGRRRFLNKIWALFGSLACLELGWLSFSLLRSGKNRQETIKKDIIIKAGAVTDFSLNSVTAIPEGQFYLVCLDDGNFLALSRTCTHLGCSLPWNSEAGKFICPCHGSSFSMTGEVLTPPATKSLNSHPLRIENGVVLVNTTRINRAGSDNRALSVKG